MKRTSFLLFFLLMDMMVATAQVTTIPERIPYGYSGEVTIIFNPNEGNKGMLNATCCYAHTGITYNGTSWQNCGQWRDGKEKYKMTKDSLGCWRLQITPSITSYYGVSADTKVTQLCFVFNDGPNGSKEGKAEGNADIFVNIADPFFINAPEPIQESRPEGVDMGIYYDSTDLSRVTLSTYAASKTDPALHVFLVGDFNNWTLSYDYQLKQDSNYFWTTLTGLTAGKEYAFQYVVMRSDSTIVRISDLYSEKVLTPDDNSEPKVVDPSLKSYPSQASGYCSVFQTGKEPYEWSEATLNFKRPDKNNLIIYELWVYDHTPKRCIAGLMDRLDYLQHLGVNCVELMPVNEFDGNINWGYSPNHYFALDKAYGTSEQLKTFIDSCHARGIAVVLDMVFNHATGNNPMNKLYPYGADLKNNPWFNVTPPHGDNVYEDWNHSFAPAHSMFIRALQYWLTEYKVDGYRMDLSHGLCGTTNDAVKNLKDYYEKGVKTVSPDAYMMLEHWGSSVGSDRPTLIAAGMQCWQNTCQAYEQTAMGWLKDGDAFTNANADGYVSYSENHDEERCFFKALQWGNGNVKTDEDARLKRVPLNMAFLSLLNGSHLFYHYAELGFDYSKYQNAQGRWGKDGVEAYGTSVATNASSDEYKMVAKYRVDEAGWMNKGSKRMTCYQQCAYINQLRTRILPDVFAGNPTNVQLASGKALRTIQWGNEVFVAGNFSVSDNQTVTLPEGTWYDYLNQTEVNYSSCSLAPGELLILTGTQVSLPVVPDHFDFATDLIDTPQDEAAKTEQTVKYLIDGQLVIKHQSTVYTILGQRIY